MSEDTLTEENVLEYRDMVFRDQKELKRFKQLETRMKQGLICELYRNVGFEICPVRYGNKQPHDFVADFIYKEGGNRIAEDVHQDYERNDLYKLKKSLFLATYPEYIFHEL